MAETARMAVFHGTGKPFEIREYPVPEPEPGAALIKIALANVCGSDLHYWRGEQDYARMGRPLPLNTGHEHVGAIAKLGEGVTTDAAPRSCLIEVRGPFEAPLLHSRSPNSRQDQSEFCSMSVFAVT